MKEAFFVPVECRVARLRILLTCSIRDGEVFLLPSVSLCLSRACLGKSIVVRLKTAWCFAGGVRTSVRREEGGIDLQEPCHHLLPHRRLLGREVDVLARIGVNRVEAACSTASLFF